MQEKSIEQIIASMNRWEKAELKRKRNVALDSFADCAKSDHSKLDLRERNEILSDINIREYQAKQKIKRLEKEVLELRRAKIYWKAMIDAENKKRISQRLQYES